MVILPVLASSPLIFLDWHLSAIKSTSWPSELLNDQLFVAPLTVSHHVSLSMGFLQARVLEWVAMPFSRESSWPGDQTQVSWISGRFFTIWTMGVSKANDWLTDPELEKQGTRWLISQEKWKLESPRCIFEFFLPNNFWAHVLLITIHSQNIGSELTWCQKFSRL